jgi:chromosome segregation ATPase
MQPDIYQKIKAASDIILDLQSTIEILEGSNRELTSRLKSSVKMSKNQAQIMKIRQEERKRLENYLQKMKEENQLLGEECLELGEELKTSQEKLNDAHGEIKRLYQQNLSHVRVMELQRGRYTSLEKELTKTKEQFKELNDFKIKARHQYREEVYCSIQKIQEMKKFSYPKAKDKPLIPGEKWEIKAMEIFAHSKKINKEDLKHKIKEINKQRDMWEKMWQQAVDLRKMDGKEFKKNITQIKVYLNLLSKTENYLTEANCRKMKVFIDQIKRKYN